MASPVFTINGSATTSSKSVTAASAVTLALASTAGVRSCSWSIVATDETTSASDYTLTPSGSVQQTCTLTSLAAGTAATVRATINGGIDPQTELPSDDMSAEGKFFVPTTAGTAEVLCADEQNDDNRVSSSTHGMIKPLNAAVRTMASVALALTGPTPPSVAHELLAFANTDARTTERTGIIHDGAGSITSGLVGITASGTVRGAALVATGDVSGATGTFTTAVGAGSAPRASAGEVRLPATGAIKARDAGNSADVALLALVADVPTLGDAAYATLAQGTTVSVAAGGNTVSQATSAGTEFLYPTNTTQSGIGTTKTTGARLRNTTAATGVTTTQVSPSLEFQGAAWTGAASQDTRARVTMVPQTSYAKWTLESSIDGGATYPNSLGFWLGSPFYMVANGYTVFQQSGTTAEFGSGALSAVYINAGSREITAAPGYVGFGSGTFATTGNTRYADGHTAYVRDTAAAADRRVWSSTSGALTVGDAADAVDVTGSQVGVTSATSLTLKSDANKTLLFGDDATCEVGNASLATTLYGSEIFLGAQTTFNNKVLSAPGFDIACAPASGSSPFTDYDPGTGAGGNAFPTCSVLRVTPTGGAVVFRSMKAGTSGQWLLLVNDGTQQLTLNYEDGAGTAAQRFWTPGQINYVVAKLGAVWLFYDGTNSRWRVVAPA